MFNVNLPGDELVLTDTLAGLPSIALLLIRMRVRSRPVPPALHDVKSPDRLTRTSGGFVIVEVRPDGRTRQKFLLGPGASLSGT